MARRRGRRSSGLGAFAGWGILIALALLGATWQRSWSVSLALALVLVAYLCWIHPSNCRVERSSTAIPARSRRPGGSGRVAGTAR